MESTLLVNTNGMIINSILRKVNFDPQTSFEPICHLVSSPQVIVVKAKLPYRTLADFVGAARAKPAELSLASVGPNTTQHIAIERLKRRAEIDLTYAVCGRSTGHYALLGGHVTAVPHNYRKVGEPVKAGKLRALATMSPNRIEPRPDVPMVAETGHRDFETDVWFGLVATGEDTEGHCRSLPPVQHGSAGTVGQGKLVPAGAVPQPKMRRRFRRSYPASVRGRCARDPRAEHQDRIAKIMFR